MAAHELFQLDFDSLECWPGSLEQPVHLEIASAKLHDEWLRAARPAPQRPVRHGIHVVQRPHRGTADMATFGAANECFRAEPWISAGSCPGYLNSV